MIHSRDNVSESNKNLTKDNFRDLKSNLKNKIKKI